MRSFGWTCLFAAGVATLALGCEDDHHHDDNIVVGMATQSTCPTPQTLTYANFGQAFFATYCQTCHGSTVAGLARKGAPADHVFDAVEDIRPLTHHIDQYAAAGPAAINTQMPPEPPMPTEAERRQLGEWLACGAP